MARAYIHAFNGLVFSPGQIVVFDFHGQNIKGVVKGISLVELAKGGRHENTSASSNLGLLMDQTDVNFLKAGDSTIKLKTSAKKYVLS